MKKLTTTEKLLLLALDDKKGILKSPVGACHLDLYLLATVFCDLLEKGVLTITQRSLLYVQSTRAPLRAYQKKILTRIRRKKKQEFSRCMADLCSDLSFQNLYQEIMDEMVERGILRKKEQYFFLVVPYSVYLNRKGIKESSFIQEIRQTLFQGENADRTCELLTVILDDVRILRDYFAEFEEWEPTFDRQLRKLRLRMHDNRVYTYIRSFIDRIDSIVYTKEVMDTVM